MKFNPTTSSQGLALAAALAANFSALPSAAQTEANGDYVGLTSGGPIGAEDRNAADGYRTIATSAQISNEGETIVAGFSLDAVIGGRPRYVNPQTAEAAPAGTNLAKGVFIDSAVTTLSIKTSLPLSEAKKGSTVDFKSFGNNGKLTIGINHYSSRLVSTRSTTFAIDQFARTCIAKAGQSWLSGEPVDSKPRSEGEVSKVLSVYDDKTKISWPARSALAEATMKEVSANFGPIALKKCDAKTGNELQNDNDYASHYGEATLGREGYAAWRRMYFRPQKTKYFGAEASLGYNRFSIIDRPTVSTATTDRIGFDVNAHAGMIWDNAGSLGLLSLGYARTFTAKKTIDFCGPPGPSGSATCVNGQDGLPDRKDTGYASISLRQVLLRNETGQPTLGILPKVTYILEDKAVQVNFPVYFQRSSSGGLDGGVQAIWNSDRKRVEFNAFVGVPF